MNTEYERRGKILEAVMLFAQQLAAESEVREAVKDWNPIISEIVLVFEETLRQEIPVPGMVVAGEVEPA